MIITHLVILLLKKKYTLYFRAGIRASFFHKYTKLDISERTGGCIIT